MEIALAAAQPPVTQKRLNLFERYLTVWVGLCMLVGVALGKWVPGSVQVLRDLELVQVSMNDLIMLALFAPIVGLLVSGASSLSVPFAVLLYSVVAFIVIPLAIGTCLRWWLVRRHGKTWFEQTLLPRFAPVTIVALLATLILIFAFQADNITGRFLHVLLIAVPILLQVYFNSSLAYGLMKLLHVPHAVAAPGALIGASNFFELAVATAIALFGPGSGAALATVVGVLVEVPVMLSVCAVCNRTRHWFPSDAVRREA